MKYRKQFPLSRTQKRGLRESKVVFSRTLMLEMAQELSKALFKNELTDKERVLVRYSRVVAEYRNLQMMRNSDNSEGNKSRKIQEIDKIREEMHRVGFDEEKITALNRYLTDLSVNDKNAFFELFSKLEHLEHIDTS